MCRTTVAFWLFAFMAVCPSIDAALISGGVIADGQTSIAYDPETGQLAIDAPRNRNINSIAVTSASELFIPNQAENLDSGFDFAREDQLYKAVFGGGFSSVNLGRVVPSGLAESFLRGDLSVVGTLQGATDGAGLGRVDLVYGAMPEFPVVPPRPPKITPGILQPGDADQDQDFDQYDMMRVLVGGKYLTGMPVTWGEGDWDGGAGGTPGNPPQGDGYFEDFDLVAALIAGVYLTGPYDPPGGGLGSSLPIRCCGVEGDDRTSLVYNAETGELAVDGPANEWLTSINVDSASGIFTGEAIRAEALGGAFDIDSDHTIFKATLGGDFESVSFGEVARPNLSVDFLLSDLTARGSLVGGGDLGTVDLVYLGQPAVNLMAGDADQDLDFDQFDLIQVQIAAKFLTGQPATWGEGDWNGAPGGTPGEPPVGDGVFNQLDVVAALAGNTYLTGPYAALEAGGREGDARTSIVYNGATGELAVDAPLDRDLTSINVSSAAGIFIGTPAQNLGGDFDNDTDDNIFKATFGSSFGSLSFGNVAQPGLSEEFVRNDLDVVGSLAGGGALGDVDLIYIPVPEAATAVLLCTGLLTLGFLRPPMSRA